MSQAHEQPIAALRPNKAWRLWAARAGWLLVFVFVTAIFIASAPTARITQQQDWQFSEALPAVWPTFSTYTFAVLLVGLRFGSLLVFYTVALLIARRKWDDWFALFVSAALLMIAFVFIGRSDTSSYSFPAWLQPTLTVAITIIFLYSWLLLFYLLPDGRFAPRWAAWFTLLPLPGMVLLSASENLRRLIPPQLRAAVESRAWGFFMVGLVLAVLFGLLAQIYRYRRVATPTQRQQMKWLLVGLGIQPLFILASIFGLGLPLGPGWSALISLLFGLFAITLLPITIGLAVFRRRLWDVDPLINRSLVYGGLTAFILLFYGLIVGGTSMLFQTQAGMGPLLVTAIAAILVVPPLNRRLGHGINRIHPVTAGPPVELALAEEPAPTPFSTKLSGRKLVFARMAWLFVLGLSMVSLAISLSASIAVDLFNTMPDLAAQLDMALARVFANNHYLSANLILFVAFVQMVAFLVVGVLLFWRRSDDWLAILASMMCISVGVGFSPNFMFLPFLRPEWQAPATIQQILTFGTLVIFLFVFPNGRFAPRWGRAVAAAWAIYTATWLFFPELNPHQASSPLALFILIGVTFVGLTAQVYRYRRVSNPVERQQSKWVMAGFITTNICFFLLVTLSVLGITPWLEAIAPVPVRLLNTIFGLAAILIPITIAFAVFRRRLWDIDLIINRALVYGGLTAAVIALYVIVVGLFSTAFRFEGSLALSVLATGLIAILFNPIRLRLQHAINRLMYGDRDDPITVIGELSRQLEHAAAPGESLMTLVEAIGRSLKLPYVALTTREGDREQTVAASGVAPPDLLRLPLIYQSRQVGELLVAPRAPGEAFSTAERRLLDNIAQQAGAAVYADQLTGHLQRSREQLVLAREEERRRLQRDLHDGLGPQLATLSMQLDVARRLAAAGSPGAIDLLAQLSADTQTAMADIRRLVYNLRPPALDQLGLVGALREYAAGQKNGNPGPRVTVDAPDALPPLPAAVEVAAYRIVQEAIANCLRHAHATECAIHLTVASGLTLEIRDNGCGLPSGFVAGVGLASMRERAAELGGACRIEAAPGGGTQVVATFPLPEDSR